MKLKIENAEDKLLATLWVGNVMTVQIALPGCKDMAEVRSKLKAGVELNSMRDESPEEPE